MAENSSSLVDDRSIADFESIAARLPWQDSSLAPHEPRVPAHQYVVVPGLGQRGLQACRMFDLIVDEHPERISPTSAARTGCLAPSRWEPPGATGKFGPADARSRPDSGPP